MILLTALRFSCLALLLLLTWGELDAQSAAMPAGFRTSAQMVLVPVTVTDHNGKTIEGLRAEDFNIDQGEEHEGPRLLEELADKTGGLHFHARSDTEAQEAAIISRPGPPQRVCDRIPAHRLWSHWKMASDSCQIEGAEGECLRAQRILLALGKEGPNNYPKIVGLPSAHALQDTRPARRRQPNAPLDH